MRYRKLGNSGLEVSELGYGAWGIGATHWVGADDDDSRAALRAAIASGVNFIDTALAYGDGHSESLVGEVVRAASETIHVATKIPPQNGKWPAEPGDDMDEMFSAAWITQATETSLRNLGLDTIDVQQLHTWTDDWVRQGDWANAVAALKEAGKIRLFGVSIRNHDPGSVLELVRSGLIDTIQVIYNIFDQSPEDELFEAALERGVGVIVRVPFDEGGLTGRIRPDTTFPEGDFRNGYFAGERKRETYERVQAIVADLGISEDEIASLALRFCLSQEAVSTVIAGMRALANVDRNVAATEEPPLDAAQLAKLRAHRWNLTG
ncbi:MAG TPA: aldo/keto reductase [Solirubrobacteraceae bacterium]|jgi:aryl-alcohol dehydrogenase-like predicted oxidoreductase